MSSRIANLSAASSGVTVRRCATRVSFPRETSWSDRQAVLFRQFGQRHVGPRAEVLNDFRCGKHAEPPADGHVAPARKPGEESRGEHVARARGVGELGDWEGGDLPSLIAIYNDAALFRASDDAKDTFCAQTIEGFIEIRRLVQREDLVGVGENRVDGP